MAAEMILDIRKTFCYYLLMGKQSLIYAIIALFLLFFSGCATYNHPRTITSQKAAELDDQYNFIKNASAFVGAIAGGIAGAASSPERDRIAGNAATWGLAGGLAGYGIGYLITGIMNATEGPDQKKINESFQEYRNIELKE